MKKYSVKICYATYIYQEVEAESQEQAVELAQTKVDAMTDEDYTNEIIENLTCDTNEVWAEDEETNFI